MKILVTGAGGMLGQALIPCLDSHGHEVIEFAKEHLDCTNYTLVRHTFNTEKPDLVMHCAAFTKVDQAEAEAKLAYFINGYATENIAVSCSALKIPMVYISTDYVFDGEKGSPYSTFDDTNPISIYGKSKLAGEIAVNRHLNKYYIVRTSWLYGPNGKNFVDAIYNMAATGKPIRVVSDQFGSPTCTLSLSEALADLIETNRYGVYHASDEGVASWYDFAKEIVKDLTVEVTPIGTRDFPRPATRPKYSVLDKSTLNYTINREMPNWKDSLKTYLELRKVTNQKLQKA